MDNIEPSTAGAYAEDERVLEQASSSGWWRSKAMKRFRRNPLAIVGALLLISFILIAVFCCPPSPHTSSSIPVTRACATSVCQPQRLPTFVIRLR